MTQLMEALLQGNNQTENNNPLSGQSASLSDQLKPMVTNPVEDFLVTMLQIADDKDVLDASFQEETVEDQMDVQENVDPLQFLDEQELVLLVTKYLAIPEPTRTQLGEQLRQELPPQVSQRLDAVLRFVQSRQG